MKFLLDLLAAIFKRPAPAAAPAPEPGPDVPASDQLVRMVTAAGCAPDRAGLVADCFAHAFERFGVADRPLVQAHILAHCAHESGNFTFLRENTSYSSVQRIRAVNGSTADNSTTTTTNTNNCTSGQAGSSSGTTGSPAGGQSGQVPCTISK